VHTNAIGCQRVILSKGPKVFWPKGAEWMGIGGVGGLSLSHTNSLTVSQSIGKGGLAFWSFVGKRRQKKEKGVREGRRRSLFAVWFGEGTGKVSSFYGDCQPGRTSLRDCARTTCKIWLGCGGQIHVPFFWSTCKLLAGLMSGIGISGKCSVDWALAWSWSWCGAGRGD
jgi:hypothetical protein